MPKDRAEVPRFADVPSAQGRWRWRRTVLEVSGVWGLGALELHGGGESMRGMNRVGGWCWGNRGVGQPETTVLPVAQSAPRHAITRTLLVQKTTEFPLVSRSGIFKPIRNSPLPRSQASSATLRYRLSFLVDLRRCPTFSSVSMMADR